MSLHAGAFAQAASVDAAPALDPVSRLLIERGWMEAPSTTSTTAPGLMQTLRDKTAEVVLAAMNYLDTPYRFGGNSQSEGFDCSGFVRHVMSRTIGLVLPRRSDEQARAAGLFEIPRSELQPGDLVFFNTLRATFSHVGIYIGDNKFIHSPRPGSAVRVEDMKMKYWDTRFTGARRIHETVVQAAEREAPPRAP